VTVTLVLSVRCMSAWGRISVVMILEDISFFACNVSQLLSILWMFGLLFCIVCYLPARLGRGGAGIVTLGVCLSVCLCICPLDNSGTG